MSCPRRAAHSVSWPRLPHRRASSAPRGHPESTGKTVLVLVSHSVYQYLPCPRTVSGPGENVGHRRAEASPVRSGTGISPGPAGMANPHVFLCASVSVAARKFKGTLATHILYPLDRAPADQSFQTPTRVTWGCC